VRIPEDRNGISKFRFDKMLARNKRIIGKCLVGEEGVDTGYIWLFWKTFDDSNIQVYSYNLKNQPFGGSMTGNRSR